MDFNKVINDMKDLQEKVKSYENKEKLIIDALSSVNKDIIKIEKKIEKEQDEVDKAILNLKILIMKDIVSRFNKGENEK